MLINKQIVNFLKNRKYRILLYFSLFIGLALYLALYLDFNRFYNFRKILLSFRKSVEIVDFERIINTISPDNGLNAKLEIISDKPYLKINGFETILLNNKNLNIRKRKALDPTLNQAIFCMGYASDYLLTHYRNNTLGALKVGILENVYLYVYKEVINPFSINSMSLNDHVISERIQFILLFYAYLKEYYPHKKELLNCLSKDFNICLGFLKNEKFFTWQTNHGIMQLRSLAQVAGVIENDKLKDSLLVLFEKRLTDIISYHIGRDGAIYEAASGYWLYIYNQFSKIKDIKSVENLKSIALLEEELKKSQKFFATVTTNDGFLQGLGDSYSTYDPDIPQYSFIEKNRFFQFSNKLIGANWSNDNNNYGVLFVSLNSPPNVHKLPEDLAVYLYINQPVFSNTGPYSYNKSPERLFIETEESQSTVIFADQPYKEPESSDVSIVNINLEDNTLTAIGTKQYSDKKSIMRRVTINPEKEIYIKDSTSISNVLVAYYNLHSGIRANKITNSDILMSTNDSMGLYFISNCHIEIVDGVISEKTNELTEIKRLKLTGNPIEVTILLPKLKLDHKMRLVRNSGEDSSRLVIAKRLELEYKSNKFDQNARKSVVNTTKVGLLFLFILISVSEIYVFFKSKI